MKKFHYVYELRLKSDPRFYYRGKHSTDDLEDGYLGSGTKVKALQSSFGPDSFTKTILKMCSSEEEALLEEEKAIGNSWKDDPFCLNQVPGQSTVSDKNSMLGKFYRIPLRKMYDINSLAAHKVFVKFCEISNQEGTFELYTGVRKRLLESLRISAASFYGSVHLLEEKGILKKLSSNIWMISPEIFWKGSQTGRQEAIVRFNEI